MAASLRPLLLLVVMASLVCDHCLDCRQEKRQPDTQISANNNVRSVLIRKALVCGRAPVITNPVRREIDDYDNNSDVDFDDDPHLDKILGGRYVSYGEFPWMAAILFDNAQICGGAIINEFWVISAAHCFVDGVKDKFTIVLGDHRLRNFDVHEHSFKVDKIIPHDEYRVNGWNFDIALIKIKASENGRGIRFNNYVQPICLASHAEDPAVGTPMTFTGWGQTHKHGNEPPTLKKAILPVVKFEVCHNLFPKVTTSNLFCAGKVDGDTDACMGDTGGPAVYRPDKSYILYGIAAFATGCRKPNYPIWFSSIPEYRGWIDATIRGHSSDSEAVMPVRSFLQDTIL